MDVQLAHQIGFVSFDGFHAEAEAIRNLQGVVSDIELKQQLDRADELEHRTGIEEQKLGVMQGSLRDQLRAQEAQIERLKAVVNFRQKQVESMKVKAIDEGVLSELPNVQRNGPMKRSTSSAAKR